VHGEYDAASVFAETLQRNLGTATAIPQYGDSVIIEGTNWKMETSAIVSNIPEVEELRSYLRSLERDYLLYRNKVEQIATRDGSKIKDLRKKLEKIKKYIDDVMKAI
ncbi:MAG: MBL fold metallo-hydrolase, partial [Acidaminococcaceae bacterium]